jgi:hypothetical protein
MEHGGQVFGQRGFVTRVILASSDVSKISSLDEEVTDLLRDFQVDLCGCVVFSVCVGSVHCTWRASCHPAVALWPSL